jgi:hypothetical protein
VISQHEIAVLERLNIASLLGEVARELALHVSLQRCVWRLWCRLGRQAAVGARSAMKPPTSYTHCNYVTLCHIYCGDRFTGTTPRVLIGRRVPVPSPVQSRAESQ